MIPGNPPVSVVELTGRELHEMLEENLERTFAGDPYEQMGGYVKRCAGITVRAKPENPRGHRIESIFVGDELLRPEAIYKVGFVTAQGVPAKYGANRAELDVRAVEALRRYIGARGTVSPCLRGSILAT